MCILTSTEYSVPAIRWLRSLWASFASCSYLTEMEWLENGERFISSDIFNSDVLLKALRSGCFFHSFSLFEALWLLDSLHFPVPTWQWCVVYLEQDIIGFRLYWELVRRTIQQACVSFRIKGVVDGTTTRYFPGFIRN